MKKICVYLALFITVLFFIFPFIGIILESSSIEKWDYLLHSNKNFKAVYNSAIISLMAVAINIVFGTPVAAALGKYEFTGKKIVELLVFLPLVIPSFVTTMGIQVLFIKLGLIDTILGVGLIHGVATFPYYIRSIKAGYSVINRNYEKMGKVMGATPLKIFFKINFPMLLPAFIAGVSLVVIVSFAQYLTTLIIGGGQILTIPILMFPYISGGDLKVGAGYSILYILVNLIMLIFLEMAVEKLVKKKNYIEDKGGESVSN